MTIFLLLVTGLAFGSFVNALVWRVHKRMQITETPAGNPRKLSAADKRELQTLSIVSGRSKCMSCGHELAAKDLVPVLSWLQLKGKCRYCGKKIPDTPVAELAVPMLFVASYLWWPYALSGSVAWVVFGLWAACLVAFVALSIYDLRWFLLPDRIVLPLVGIAAMFRLVLALQAPSGQLPTVLLGGLWGAALLAGFFYLLFMISDGAWIGGGDVKLGIALGLLAGGPLAVLLLLFIASVSGSLAVVPAMIAKKPIRQLRIPFGPFLIAATIFTVVFGQSVLDWYTGLFTL